MTTISRVNMDGATFNVDDLSEDAKRTLESIEFVDSLIRQRQNEWAIADTSRLAYLAALKREVLK